MSNPLFELACKLIDIPSLSGNEKPMSDFLALWLEQRGWVVRLQEVETNRYNLFAARPTHANPALIFNSHMDTVPPYFPAKIAGSLITGRGACDTKSIIAAQLLAGERLLADGVDDFGYLYVVGEEVDHSGIIKANDLHLNPQHFIVGEPTESKFASRQKGILRLAIDVKGQSGHSGYPHTGKSAVEPLICVLHDLIQYRWPADPMKGDTTVNIGKISGGIAANVIPDRARAEVMFRVSHSLSELKVTIEKIIADRVPFKINLSSEPLDLCTLPGMEAAPVSFHTDIPYFDFSGKAYLWGPGSIIDAHTDHEKIDCTELSQAVDHYHTIAKRLCGTPKIVGKV